MANPSKKSKKSTGYRKYIIGFWTLFSLGILTIVFLFLLASWGAFGKMPKFEELENPETNLATEIFLQMGRPLENTTTRTELLLNMKTCRHILCRHL
jgi:penicillin-binding protein 1A